MSGAGLTETPFRKALSDMLAFKPYWGKPAVRDFRGGDGNVGIIRSPVRAIVLPDHLFQRIGAAQQIFSEANMTKLFSRIFVAFILLSLIPGNTLLKCGQDDQKLSGPAAWLIKDTFRAERCEEQKNNAERETGTDKLLQYTAGGHVLGLRKGEMFIASGDHALRVEFVNGRPVSPGEEAKSRDPESNRLRRNRSEKSPMTIYGMA